MATDKKISYEVQGGVKNYKPSKMVTAPKTAKSSPKHPTAHLAYITKKEQNFLVKKNLHGSLKGKPNKGPSGIVSLQGDFGPGGTGGSYGGHEGADVSGTSDRGTGDYGVTDRAVQNAYNKNRSIREANERAVDKMRGLDTRLSGGINTTSRWGGLGGLLRGALGIFGGIPGKIGSVLSRINPSRLRGINPVTGLPNTQEEYEQMVADRKTQGRIDSMTDRMLAGKTFSRTNLDSLLGQQQTYGANIGQNFGTNLGNIDNARGSNLRGVLGADRFANTVGPLGVNTNTMGYENALGDNWATGNVNTNYSSQLGNLYPDTGLGAKDGGRIGYRGGLGVDPVLDVQEDENTLEFMNDQGIPHGEMTETSPFEIRIQELMDEGMSWQEAYQIASEEFGQVVEGESDQGIASIV